MIANTVRSDKSGPTLRGHSITLEKVLVKSPVENRHTKVRCPVHLSFLGRLI